MLWNYNFGKASVAWSIRELSSQRQFAINMVKSAMLVNEIGQSTKEDSTTIAHYSGRTVC